MKITIKNNEASDFHTLVMYSNPFLPSYEDYHAAGGSTLETDYINAAIDVEARSSKVLYLYDSSNINEASFTEYDFKYFPEKYKFNDTPKIEYLTNDTKEFIGPNYKDLYNLESSIFPTAVDVFGAIPDKIGYFSFYTQGSQEIYVFNVPSGVSKLELYSSSLVRNIIGNSYISPTSGSKNVPEYSFIDGVEFLEDQEIAIEPDLIINLGPEFNDSHNMSYNSSWYYTSSGISWSFSNPIQTDYSTWVSLRDEREKNKVIYLVVSHDIDLDGKLLIKYQINLSYSAWLDSINPNRNMWKYSLRNDDSSSVVSPIYNDSLGFIYDGTSRTLTGLTEGNTSPYLTERSSGNKWNKKAKYWSGDIVKVGDREFLSICDENIGNHPCTSGKWIDPNYLERSVLSYPIQVVVPLINSKSPGNVEPNGIVSIPKQISTRFRKLFYYTTNIGYQFSHISSSIDSTVIDMREPNDYSKQIILNSDGTLSYRVTVENWDKPKLSNFLYFHYKIKAGSLICKIGYIDSPLNPEDANEFGQYDFEKLIETADINWDYNPIPDQVTNEPIIMIKTGNEPYSRRYYYDNSILPSDKLFISFTIAGQSNYENYEFISSGVIYQQSQDRLLYKKLEIIGELDVEEDEYNYQIIDSSYNYPTLYLDPEETKIIFPQYSFILYKIRIPIYYLTTSMDIHYEHPILYKDTKGAEISNRFEYTGNASSLSVSYLGIINRSFQVKHSLIVSDPVDLDIIWNSNSKDYNITINRNDVISYHREHPEEKIVLTIKEN